MASALGAYQIATVMKHTGLSREELLSTLGEQLPEVVNHVTPEGRLPTEHEVSRWL